MAEFFYEGIKDGKKVKGKAEAFNRKEVLQRLKSEGVIPLNVEELKKEKPFWKREIHLGGPSEEDIAFILRQLAVLISSGIPLSKALELISSQLEDHRISSTLLQIKGDIERGESISGAFRKSGLFPSFLPEMLTAAETGENLERIFEIAGTHLETVADMKSKVINAVTYPAVVIFFSFLALLIAVKFVVPKIAGVLESFGRELPPITKAILLFSELLTLLVYLMPIFIGIFLFREKLLGKGRMDFLLLKLPVVGKISFFFNLSRFAYTLYMTLSTAVPITAAFKIAVGSITNFYMKAELEKFLTEIERGKSVSWVLKNVGIFPSLFINLVETGENSGELESMLKLSAEIYKREALKAINTWIKLIEPLSILLIGIVVGIIVLSVLLPLTEITSGIRK